MTTNTEMNTNLKIYNTYDCIYRCNIFLRNEDEEHYIVYVEYYPFYYSKMTTHIFIKMQIHKNSNTAVNIRVKIHTIVLQETFEITFDTFIDLVYWLNSISQYHPFQSNPETNIMYLDSNCYDNTTFASPIVAKLIDSIYSETMPLLK